MLQPHAVLKPRLASLRDTLSTDLVERDTPIRLALLAALAGEHLLLLGPPGVAKSEIARRLRHAFRDSAFFERLLTRFSVPEELFGPLSLKALEEDRYERQTHSYLPTASVAFLDEIFKANSAILNSLLTILNEREFDNGTQRVRVPLVSVIGASNELPEGEELHALYDRFLLRCHVGPVSGDGFDALLDLRGSAQPKPDMSQRLSRDELEQLRDDARSVSLSAGVRALLKALRAFLAEQKIAVSDRRWRKIVFLLQVSARSEGRSEVSVWDCWLLQHCTWEKPEQRSAIFDWYKARIGANAGAAPAMLGELVAAHEKEVEREKQSRSQARDAEGRLLFVGPDDKPVTEDEGRRQLKDKDGQPLYLARGDHELDRTNGGRGLTQSDLDRKYSWYGTGLPGYVADRANWLMGPTNNPPLLEPTRYSAHHVEGRVRQVDELLAQLRAEREAVEGQLTSVTELVEGHLWISPGFTEDARAHLEDRRRHLEQLDARLAAVLTDLRKLPRSDR